VVFDFDGVILESADLKTHAFLELFAHLPDEALARVRAHHLANMGISRFKKFEWIYQNILGRALSPDDSAALGRRFSELALGKVLAAPFVHGAQAALSTLSATYPLFVASGTPQDELTHIVEARALGGFFREVWGTPAEKPAILRDLMTRHRWSSDQVLFIGDGLSDHKAAIATGVHFLARDTSELHDEWTRLGVRRVDDLSDLARVVAQW
jgi:phosphoglycolate phosphatase-like HAD superfamily hydrolase